MVGVVMSEARWQGFLRRGFFPAVPQPRMCFQKLSARDALAALFPKADEDHPMAAPIDLLLIKV